ncbi:hypothetical protein ACFY3V_36465 [Streptosporangium sp. NPDC000095]
MVTATVTMPYLQGSVAHHGTDNRALIMDDVTPDDIEAPQV